MKIRNILWDTDGDGEALASLPKEVELPSPILQVGKNGSTRFPTGCPTSLDSVIWGSMSVMTTSEVLPT